MGWPDGGVGVECLEPTFRKTHGFDIKPDLAVEPGARGHMWARVGAFLACVRGERGRPGVTGGEAARALDLALAIERAVDEAGPRHHV